MQKYVLVKFLEPMNEGDEFIANKGWPLHITLVVNFTIPFDAQKLHELLADTLQSQRAVSVVASKDEFFGPTAEVRVTTINMTPELVQLHKTLADLLELNGAEFSEPKYMRDGYRAHATVQAKSRLHEGDSVLVDEVTIVDMFPDNDIAKRKVLKTIKLS